MSNKLIFLSHIHEEKLLAILLKDAIENEFSGFVDVFVSSDGSSIIAGSNFLKKIESSLINCIGAIYLISPMSVKKNWINFELGAVWVRNVMSIANSLAEIPTLPICHSGMKLSGLPMPLNNLNAIQANEASQLEFAFRSLQTAVGGKGALRTDFDKLAADIVTLERQYTIGSNLKEMFTLMGGDIDPVITHCEMLAQRDPNSSTNINCGFLENNIVQSMKNFEANQLNGIIKVTITSAGMRLGPMGASNGANLALDVPVSLILAHKDQLRAR